MVPIVRSGQNMKIWIACSDNRYIDGLDLDIKELKKDYKIFVRAYKWMVLKQIDKNKCLLV